MYHIKLTPYRRPHPNTSADSTLNTIISIDLDHQDPPMTTETEPKGSAEAPPTNLLAETLLQERVTVSIPQKFRSID